MTCVRSHRLIPALLLLLTAGCGGGGGGGGTFADGGIGGTGISTGAVTATGSIVVNGRRFTLSSAAITVNGNPADASALRIGRIVTVNGDLESGIAERVAFVPRLVGAVDGPGGSSQIDCTADTGTFKAVRQTVRIEPSTIVDCGSGNTVQAGQRVLVSGYRRQDDVLVASYVERLDSNTQFPDDQVIGRVTDTSPTGFAIGGLRIEASDTPAIGDRVLVRGNYRLVNGILTARAVIDQPPLTAAAGRAAEVEGIVNDFDGRADFEVNGTPVDGRGARIEGPLGGDASDRLGPNAEVEVEGRFNAAGVLVAERIQVEIEENVELFADVASVDVDAGIVRFFDGGRLAIEVTDSTRLKDDRDDIVDFGLEDIAPGDRLELEGFSDGDRIGATRIDREEADPETTIEAPVQRIVKDENNETVTVLGLPPIDISRAVDSGDPIDTVEEDDIVELGWEGGRQPLADPADHIEEETD